MMRKEPSPPLVRATGRPVTRSSSSASCSAMSAAAAGALTDRSVEMRKFAAGSGRTETGRGITSPSCLVSACTRETLNCLSMSITTRRADLADVDLLHDLAARTFGLACPPGTLQADIDAFIARHLSAESFRGYLSDPGRIILIAADGEVPLGYSMLVSGPIADPAVAKLIDA